MDKDKLIEGGAGHDSYNPEQVLSKYPKPDTGFGKKNGLDLDIYQSGIYQSRPYGFR